MRVVFERIRILRGMKRGIGMCLKRGFMKKIKLFADLERYR